MNKLNYVCKLITKFTKLVTGESKLHSQMSNLCAQFWQKFGDLPRPKVLYIKKKKRYTISGGEFFFFSDKFGEVLSF